MEIRRFGVGHRRPEGPAGSTGVAGQVIHGDARGVVSELAFTRGGRVEPHENPNTTWFCVIEGGGWVSVGDERQRIAAGEAVLWPANVAHGAWAEHSEMRAIVVEFAGADDAHLRGILEGRARALGPGESSPPDRADGRLTSPPGRPPRPDPDADEPA